MNVFDELTRQHRRLERMLVDLASSDPSSERRRAVRVMTDALLWHMDSEEHLLDPLLTDVDAAAARESDADHRLARQALERMSQLVDEPGFHVATAMLLGGLRRHINHEEFRVFPALSAVCTPSQLAAVGDALRVAGDDAVHAFQPPDELVAEDGETRETAPSGAAGAPDDRPPHLVAGP